MICPGCGKDNVPGARFCSNCGYSLDFYGHPEFDPYDQGRFPQADGSREHRSRGFQILIGAEILVLVILAGVFWYVGGRLTGPESTLEKYWDAREEGRWEQVYACSDLPDSDLLTAQMLVDAMRHREDVSSWEEVERREDGDQWIYTVEYQIGQGSDAKAYETEVTLIPVGRKWGLFQEWKVSGDSLLVKNSTFYLPSGSQLYLNGEEVEFENTTEEDGTLAVEIPWMFEGDYQMQVTKDGMETYQTNLTIKSQEEGFQYEVIMRPARQLEKELVEQSGTAIQLILQNALSGKDFGTVSDLFCEEAIESGEAAEEYNAIKEIRSDGRAEGVTFFEIYNLEGQISTQTTEEGGLYMEMQGNGKKRYVSEFMGRLNQEISEGVLKLDFEYVLENDQWRLGSMPITEEDIRSI